MIEPYSGLTVLAVSIALDLEHTADSPLPQSSRKVVGSGGNTHQVRPVRQELVEYEHN